MKYFYEIYRDLPVKKPNIFKSWKHRLINPSYKVMYLYRKGKYFSESKSRILRVYSAVIRTKLIFKRNCEISYKAEIGNNFILAHPVSIVIGAGVIIKNNVTIFQNVTLGSHGKGKLKPKKYPTIENNVTIYAGAVIIGGIKIGENSVVGANTVVNTDVPSNSIAIGNPCKITPRK